MNLNPFTFFNVPSADQIALQQLEQARRDLLEAQRAKEHFDATVAQLQKTVERLSKRLPDGTND